MPNKRKDAESKEKNASNISEDDAEVKATAFKKFVKDQFGIIASIFAKGVPIDKQDIFKQLLLEIKELKLIKDDDDIPLQVLALVDLIKLSPEMTTLTLENFSIFDDARAVINLVAKYFPINVPPYVAMKIKPESIDEAKVAVKQREWKISDESMVSYEFNACKCMIIRGDKASFFTHIVPGFTTLPDVKLIEEQCGKIQGAILITGGESVLAAEADALIKQLNCDLKKIRLSHERFFVQYDHDSGDVITGSRHFHQITKKYLCKWENLFPTVAVSHSESKQATTPFIDHVAKGKHSVGFASPAKDKATGVDKDSEIDTENRKNLDH